MSEYELYWPRGEWSMHNVFTYFMEPDKFRYYRIIGFANI